MLALRTRRPVKMSYGRQESFYGHVHRHPSRIWMRHGALRDGTLVNVQARLLVDGGAYTSTSPAVIGNATTFAAGPYEVPNARLVGTAVFTNNPPCGAMRGFGAVQACFAYEAQIAGVKTAAVEVGQGIDTIVTQIVRTELGIDRVVVRQPDTTIGSAGSSSASRQTMMTGGAVQLACQAVRTEIERHGGLQDLRQPVEASRVFHHRPTRKLDADGQGDPHVSFAFGAARAVVEVDTDLGLVRVVQLAVAQDVGRALNPQSVLGQIEGGSAQGLGLALMEEVTLVDGQVKNASFTDYLIPTILDMPPVVSEMIEEPEPGLPYGAKGVGEPSTVVVPAAVVAALRNATGRELRRAPVRPDDLVGL